MYVESIFNCCSQIQSEREREIEGERDINV